ncbi:MAG: hypothetical protein K6T65_10800 [Peptococcaceae bacterium]|nr:hypothetical protein [Peptococcaceae bacterium]
MELTSLSQGEEKLHRLRYSGHDTLGCASQLQALSFNIKQAGGDYCQCVEHQKPG